MTPAERIRKDLEHAPADPGEIAPGLKGWIGETYAVCARCAGRLFRRGCGHHMAGLTPEGSRGRLRRLRYLEVCMTPWKRERLDRLRREQGKDAPERPALRLPVPSRPRALRPQEAPARPAWSEVWNGDIVDHSVQPWRTP